MDSRQKAIEELKKQIRLGKERLGPEGIRQLQELAQRMPHNMPNTAKPASPPGAKPHIPPGSVPYDKKAAMQAFQLFLKNHGDPKEFERRLRALLQKSSH